MCLFYFINSELLVTLMGFVRKHTHTHTHTKHLFHDQFSCLVVSLWDPMNCSTPASLSITNSQRLLKLSSIESVMPSNHRILCRPYSSCLQSFPTSGSFQMSQLFASDGQNIGVSASTSVLPMNTQD